MDKNFNVAIIGLGHLHPRAYMQLFENCKKTTVVAACDGNSELRESFCKDYGIKGYAKQDDLIASERIDIAAIFMPHCECQEAAVKCSKKGIHLMIEKPIAATVRQVETIAEAARENNVKITTGYCWRYHPVIKAMKECIEKGMIGDVVSVEAKLAAGRVERYINGNSRWMLEKQKSGGGPMYNLGVHWIDILCHLLGDKVGEVCAMNTKINSNYDIEDSTAAILKFDSGPVGTLTTSYIVPDCYPCGRELYLGVKGVKGVLSYAPKYEGEGGSSGAGQVDVLELYSDSDKMAGASGRKFAFALDKVAGYSGYMGKAYLEDFVEAIAKDREPTINITQAIEVLKVVEAIYKSDSEKKWVKVQ